MSNEWQSVVQLADALQRATLCSYNAEQESSRDQNEAGHTCLQKRGGCRMAMQMHVAGDVSMETEKAFVRLRACMTIRI
jgi:hypothetical protein